MIAPPRLTEPWDGEDVTYIRGDLVLELINAVERYVRQECSRSTLLAKKDKLKQLIDT